MSTLESLSPAAKNGLLTFLTELGIDPNKPILKQDPLTGVPDAIFSGGPQAYRAFPYVYRSLSAVRWKLRNRHENGLIACGAVVERFNGGNRRPTLTIHHRKWVEYERGLQSNEQSIA